MSLLGNFFDLVPVSRPGPPKRGVRVYYDALTRALRQITSSGVDSAFGGGGGTSDHAALTNRGWTVSGHTGTGDRIAGFGPLGSAVYYEVGVDVQAYDADLADIAGLADVQGDILIRGASGWQRLAAGTSGQVLTTKGSSNNPVWGPAGLDIRVNDYFAAVPRGTSWSAIGLLNATLTGFGSSGTLAWYGGGQPYREASAGTTADGQIINGMQGESTRSLYAASTAKWAVEFKFRTPDTTLAYIGNAWFAVGEGQFTSDTTPASLTSINLIGIHFDNTGTLTLATRGNGGAITTATITGTVAAGTLYAVRLRWDGATAYGALATVDSSDNRIGNYGTEASSSSNLPLSTTTLTPSSRITQSHSAPSVQKMWLGAVMGVFGT